MAKQRALFIGEKVIAQPTASHRAQPVSASRPSRLSNASRSTSRDRIAWGEDLHSGGSGSMAGRSPSSRMQISATVSTFSGEIKKSFRTLARCSKLHRL
ncbi:MAG: hypothetical protein R2855_04880 [Thermomicrobiales bacterium]